jgi:hypothetical protein
MTESNHIDESVARKVSDAIRNKGGVFIGTHDWFEATGITPDEYEAFLDYGVRYAAQLDYKDAHSDIPGAVNTKGVVDKFTGDSKKVTVQISIDPHNYGDVATIQRIIGEPLDLVMYPIQAPLPLDDDGQYIPEGVEQMF